MKIPYHEYIYVLIKFAVFFFLHSRILYSRFGVLFSNTHVYFTDGLVRHFRGFHQRQLDVVHREPGQLGPPGQVRLQLAGELLVHVGDAAQRKPMWQVPPYFCLLCCMFLFHAVMLILQSKCAFSSLPLLY